MKDCFKAASRSDAPVEIVTPALERTAPLKDYDPADNAEKCYAVAIDAMREKLASFRCEEIGACRLYLGDCREILPLLPRVDAVVTDPPYGIGWKPRVNHQDQRWVDEIDFDIRKFLVGRYHLIWGGQYFADKLPASEGWLTWCKRPIDVDFSNDDRSYATSELAWRDWGKAKFMSLVWDGGMRAGDPANRTFCHPSQKPVEVMDWCIRQLPTDAETVLDPFMGSGTTGVACAKRGLRFVGVEVDEGYFSIACRRIEEAYKQGDLFVERPKPTEQLSLLDSTSTDSQATAPTSSAGRTSA